jgi:REP element-mobilizing transposase RayT
MTNHRDLSSSEWFHVVQKGADAQDIFSAASHRSVYEDLLADAFTRFGVDLHAYAWMTNHTHLLAHAPRGGLPDAMHLLGSRYASMYNGWTNRSGPLFTARYFSEPVTSDAQLVQTARYIHRNPMPIVGCAGLSEYPWSSLGPLIGRRPLPDWLSTGVVVSDDDADSHERFVLTPQPGDRLPFGWLPPSIPTGCTDIEFAVAAVVGRTVDDLRSPRGTVSDEARMVMITLAVDYRADTSSALAKRYGLSDQRSVRRIARRGRARVADSVAFASLRRRVVDVLDANVAAATAAVPGDPGSGGRRGSRRPGLGELRAAG